MNLPLVLVTGFGPFARVPQNPSGMLALALAKKPSRHCRIKARVLPVTFAGAPDELASFVRTASKASALLGMGVHPGEGFLLERCAKAVPDSASLDNAGESAQDFGQSRSRTTGLDLEQLANHLQPVVEAQGADLSVSENAGGFVCDWTYQHILQHAERLGLAGLFLHVPPLEQTTFAKQLAVVQELVYLLARGPSLLSVPRGQTHNGGRP